MITMSIKDQFGSDTIKREHGARLRTFLESNWDQTDVVEIDFGNIKIASASFFDEAIGKLVFDEDNPTASKSVDEIKGKILPKNLDPNDRVLLNDVILDRLNRLKARK